MSGSWPGSLSNIQIFNVHIVLSPICPDSSALVGSLGWSVKKIYLCVIHINRADSKVWMRSALLFILVLRFIFCFLTYSWIRSFILSYVSLWFSPPRFPTRLPPPSRARERGLYLPPVSVPPPDSWHSGGVFLWWGLHTKGRLQIPHVPKGRMEWSYGDQLCA